MNAESPMQDKMRKAADSAVLLLIARISMAVVIPAGGFIGAALWIKLDKTAESTTRLEEKVSNLVDRQLPDINTRFDGRFNAQAERITSHDRRLDRLEDWRNSMPGKAQ